ncbi:polysaccharide deacetylase family protein [Kitasatospora fiedleri]|uniref:polysaccharide deacetylase family protein n=1 Tax=Kitasatospora fiedleri TaxID=2991545 RepID=UPI00249BF96A|nr:polysaccharide deacetylase family protein [Kitasatospora fiedleri]
MTARPAGRRRAARRGPLHWVARLSLVVMALSVLALPFYASWKYYVFRRDVTPQSAVGPVRLDRATQAAWQSGSAQLPDAAPPVVLTYHDISPTNRSEYVVTPERFDQQLTALEAAGYRTLTTDEFVDYLKGGPAPPRSVYITFDDGTNGLWVYGDRILAKHHMHAASYLITGKVDHNRPYYLSWAEVSRMAASGRWDFQDHTHDLHQRGQVDATGTQASALSNRLWLAAQQRIETVEEYQTRLDTDIAQSLEDFRAHDLPRPQLFAYPFSEMSERINVPIPGPSLQGILERTFTATLTDLAHRPLPAGRRAAAAKQVQRLEVFQTTTAEELLGQVKQWTLVPPALDAPLQDAASWVRTDASNAKDVGALTGAGPYPGKTGYVSADLLPLASADWTDYTVTADVADLADSTNNVNLTTRNDSLDPITVGLSRSTVTLLRGSGDKREQIAAKPLVAAAAHQLQVTVTGKVVKVLVDGRTELSTETAQSGGNATGGIGLSVRNGSEKTPWPKFTALKVAQAPPGAGVATPTTLTVAKAVLLDPGASWVTAPGVPSGMRVGGDGLAPTGLALSDYAAFEPERTEGWSRYTVRGTVRRLNTPGVSAAVWARVGSPSAVSVEVSRRGVRVLSGAADSRKLVASRALPDADHHDVAITVGTEMTWVTVDGNVNFALPAAPGGGTGGVAFSAYRDVTKSSWPTVRQFKVFEAQVK